MWGLRTKNSLRTNVPFAERHSVLFIVWADMKRHIREKSLMNVRCVENILVIHLFWEDTEKYIQEKNHILVIFVAKNSVRGVRWTCIVWSPILILNSFPASGYFCHLLITFASSLDPDKAWQNVGPDLDPKCLTLWWYSWKIFLKKLNPQMTKKHANLPSMQIVKVPIETVADNILTFLSEKIRHAG